MIKAALLDRDGVINQDTGHVYKIQEFKFIEGVFEALNLLQSSGFEIIIITNQAGIAKGFYTENDYKNLTNWYLNVLKTKNINVLDVFHCPYHHASTIEKYKKKSFYRKPNPGMFLDAIKIHNIDVTKSFSVGDKFTDIQASMSAGIKQNFLIYNEKETTVENLNYVETTSLFDVVNNYIIK